jgi:aspartyl protease family protein
LVQEETCHGKVNAKVSFDFTAKLTAWAFASLLCTASYSQIRQSYIVYDGQTYPPAQLEQAASSPVVRTMQRPLSGQSFAIAKAADGHYYANGEVNGFPMTFMVDTGATYTSIPSWMAINAGIRAGLAGVSRTAAGPAQIGTSKNNSVKFGSFDFNAATVIVLDKLEYPVLGAELLNILRTSYKDGWMVLSK